MRLIDKVINTTSRSEVFEIYPLGDIHLGARSCAETHLAKLVARIAKNPRAYIVGGGDWLDAIVPQDKKRFDFDTLPDWMLEGDATTIREQLKDILRQQRTRLQKLLAPIPPDRWLGALEGNHERDVSKYHGRSIHDAICREMGIEPLTDEALIRLRFRWDNRTLSIILYIRHGYGSGRAAGAEPNKLDALLKEWEVADICFTGHTHVFHVAPPKAVLEIPKRGSLPPECTCRYRWAGNWGCWVRSHATGPSSYASRACYPARPLLSCYATIKPYHCRRLSGNYLYDNPQIEIRQVIL